MKTLALRLGGLVMGLAVIFGFTGCGSYNRLVTLEQNVNKKWADVQSVYQRRADLIPNLVNTVSGAANFEKSTLTEVTNARASVGRVTLDASRAPTDAAQLQEFQAAQGQLSNALSRLMMVTENYPQLRATEAFQNLQAQLEGTENRISVERNNFNAAGAGVQHRDGDVPDQHVEQDVRLPGAPVLHRASWC
jgi:LemA protein